MPKKRLTEEMVRKLNPPAQGKIDFYDAGMPGLVLRVNSGGSKSWLALYYLKRLDKDGKRVSIPTTAKIGRYPVLQLKEAREKARTFLADPQKAKAEADTDSFQHVAANFIRRHVAANGLRSQGEIERCLNRYILPAWQHRPFRDIRRGDVTSLLDHIEDQHGKRQADVVLAIIRKMMNWFATRSDDYLPCIIRGMHRNGASKRKRILNDDEVRALWAAEGTFGALVKVLLLTGQRRDKVATMRWPDIKDGVWTIASEAREKTNAGSLRLPQQVLDLIEAQPRIAGNPFVFPGRGAGPFMDFTRARARLEPSMPDWVIHDLRRTARSLMSRAGIRPDISERVLGHAIRGVEGTYDRHSYDSEKADALLRLAALVDNIVDPPSDNVVPLTAHRVAT